MNDPELVKVGHRRHDLRELKVRSMNKRGGCGNITSGLTNRKRFACGFDLAYCITFPFAIHSVRMRKQCLSTDTETPNNGKMFGWDKCFQPMISRHSRWVKAEQR